MAVDGLVGNPPLVGLQGRWRLLCPGKNTTQKVGVGEGDFFGGGWEKKWDKRVKVVVEVCFQQTNAGGKMMLFSLDGFNKHLSIF